MRTDTTFIIPIKMSCKLETLSRSLYKIGWPHVRFLIKILNFTLRYNPNRFIGSYDSAIKKIKYITVTFIPVQTLIVPERLLKIRKFG